MDEITTRRSAAKDQMEASLRDRSELVGSYLRHLRRNRAEHTPEEVTMQQPTAPQQAPTTNSQLTIDDLMRHAGQRQNFLSSSQPRLVRTADRRRRRSLRFRRRQLLWFLPWPW